MIPAQFDLKRASSAAEAISLIGEYGDEAKLLAGLIHCVALATALALGRAFAD